VSKTDAEQRSQDHGQPRGHYGQLLQVRIAKRPVELKHGAQAEKQERGQQQSMSGELHANGCNDDEEEVFAVMCLYSQLVCVGLMCWSMWR
jgi:hypothetical protein